MKKLTTLLFLIIVSIDLLAQSDTTSAGQFPPPPPVPTTIIPAPPHDTVEEIYDIVEVPPEFPGGMSEMYNFLGDNIVYPLEAQVNYIQGKVYVQFVVTKTGEITEIKIIKGTHKLLDQAALDVIEAMPNWTPGEQRGKKVNVRYTIPIFFTINDMSKDELKAKKKELKKQQKKNNKGS